MFDTFEKDASTDLYNNVSPFRTWHIKPPTCILQPHNIVITWRTGLDPLGPRNMRGIIPKWCDFGLGRYVHEDTEAEAQSVSVEGNLKYMDPKLREKLKMPLKDGFKASGSRLID